MSTIFRGIPGFAFVACAFVASVAHFSSGEERGELPVDPLVNLLDNRFEAVIDSQIGYYRIDGAFLAGEDWQPGDELEVGMPLIQENALRALSEHYPSPDWRLVETLIHAYGNTEVDAWYFALTFAAEAQFYTVISSPSGRIFPVGMTHSKVGQGEFEAIVFEPHHGQGPHYDPFDPDPPVEGQRRGHREGTVPVTLERITLEWNPGNPLELEGGVRELLNRAWREQQIAIPPSFRQYPIVSFQIGSVNQEMQQWMATIIFGDTNDPLVWTRLYFTPEGTLIEGHSMK